MTEQRMSDVSPGDEVVVYDAPDGEARLNVRFDQDTVWLTQRQMAEVFATSSENVVMHLRNVFAHNELDERATAKDFLVVRKEGSREVRRSLRARTLRNQALVEDTGQAMLEPLV